MEKQRAHCCRFVRGDFADNCVFMQLSGSTYASGCSGISVCRCDTDFSCGKDFMLGREGQKQGCDCVWNRLFDLLFADAPGRLSFECRCRNGVFIGWLLERRFVQFEAEDTWAHKCVKFVIGGNGIVFILEVVYSALSFVMASKYAGFFRSFTLAVFIMAVYLFFFCRKSRYKAGIALAAVLTAGTLGFSAWQAHANRLKELSDAQQQVQSVQQDDGPKELSDAEQQVQNVQQLEGQVVEIIAHRGYSSVFPENTLASFAGALDIGVDYIELDVQLSKDGEVVILHDDSLQRTTGVEGTTADFTCEEL